MPAEDRSNSRWGNLAVRNVWPTGNACHFRVLQRDLSGRPAVEELPTRYAREEQWRENDDTRIPDAVV